MATVWLNQTKPYYLYLIRPLFTKQGVASETRPLFLSLHAICSTIPHASECIRDCGSLLPWHQFADISLRPKPRLCWEEKGPLTMMVVMMANTASLNACSRSAPNTCWPNAMLRVSAPLTNLQDTCDWSRGFPHKCTEKMASEMASPELGNARTDFSTAAVRTLAVLRELSERYQEMVVKDPEFTSKIETVLRLASYIIPGALQIESWNICKRELHFSWYVGPVCMKKLNFWSHYEMLQKRNYTVLVCSIGSTCQLQRDQTLPLSERV